MLNINSIYCGDCLEIMKYIDDDSIDAIITDPPYELGFMGKLWDSSGVAYNINVWKETIRILKPGGYLLSFGGSRTYHRMACAIEDAGFEIRDMIEWIYGSGFPKSLNIGKAVDKLQGNERIGMGIIKHHAQKGVAVAEERGAVGAGAFGQSKDEELTKGTSEWEGWGTALKPAHEPICMARKPLSEKSVAENCLKWGTGGINIDECRVDFIDNKDIDVYDNNRRGITERSKLNEGDKITEDKTYDGGWKKQNETPILPLGRFPANLIHDGSDEVVELFPKDAKSGKSNNNAIIGEQSNNIPFRRGTLYSRNDSGSAARFFYCAKASKSERNMGCEEEYILKEATPEEIKKEIEEILDIS
ncbi:MAG: site-specific DNA-methyltransferase [Clostridiaceae bacterium]|nr:site-specific DNA-methyltransferase [Clostridiaceae bacterium]